MGNTLAEACAYGLVTTLMMLSFLLQLSFMVQLPIASLYIEIFLTIIALGYILRWRKELLLGWTTARAIYSRTRLASTAIGVILIYLALQALIIPPTTHYWQPLGQVLVFSHYGTLFPVDIPGMPPPFPQAFSPVNTLILPHLFLRFQTDSGVGCLGFMAYLSIGFSAYALSRRYAWPPTAATASIIIISMPRLVYLSTSPGYEIIPVATALFCLLATFRAVESPNILDLYLLGLGILFMLSGSYMNVMSPLVLTPLACILLFRRHGATTWWKLLTTRPYFMLLLLIPAVVFSQIWQLLSGIPATGNNLAPLASPPVVFNADGIQGALANAIRYTLQSIHFTRPVDSLLNWATGFSLTGALQQINENLVVPFFGNRGAAAAFHISWLPNEKLSWFGPFAFLLILPALGYAAMRAPRRLKTVSIALFGYVFLVSLIPAWHSENASYFNFFFVCGGICIAFFLPPWRLTRSRRRVLVAISVCLLVYAGICNDDKPAFGLLSEDAKGGIWHTSGWGRKRFWAAKLIYGDNRLEAVQDLLSDSNPLWLIYTDFSLTYPFLLNFPCTHLYPVVNFIPEKIEKRRAMDAGMFMFVDCSIPSWIENRFAKTMWSSSPEPLNRPGALVQIDWAAFN